VLPRLERPDKVERLVRERHLERVCHLKRELVAESGGGGELVGALRLVRRQRDADAVAPERAGDVARRAPDAAADVEHAARRRLSATSRPQEHLVDHVALRLYVVLPLGPGGIVAVVHVLAPHALPQRGAPIVERGDAALQVGAAAVAILGGGLRESRIDDWRADSGGDTGSDGQR